VVAAEGSGAGAHCQGIEHRAGELAVATVLSPRASEQRAATEWNVLGVWAGGASPDRRSAVGKHFLA
jgi:hypothetical protein